MSHPAVPSHAASGHDAPRSHGAAAAPDRGGKFLTFYLAEEEYGVAILKVQEIIGLQPITRVPRTPPFIRGVINLRGKVIPIMDLRERFGMERAEAALAGASESEIAAAEAVRCIIVVEVLGPTGQAVPVGIVVDRVSEVAAIAGSEIEDAPSFGAGVRTEYLLGLGKAQGRVKLLLDIDRVLAAEELASLAPALDHAA
jgi:purine-binding chemotaxis protein CheW